MGIVRQLAIIGLTLGLLAGSLTAPTRAAASPAPTSPIVGDDPDPLQTRPSAEPLVEAVMLEGPSDLTGEMVEAGGLFFFPTRDETGGWSLWRSDGMSEGTYPVETCRTVLVCGATIEPREFGAPLVAAGDLVYFSTSQGLWRSDGSAAGTFMVAKDADMNDRDRRGPPKGAERRRLLDEDCDVLAAGARLYLVASVDCLDPYPRQLWITDGTRRGTRLLEPSLQADPSFMSLSARIGRSHLFGADGGLWTTDGTRKGTRRLTDPGEGDRSDPGARDVTAADERAWFTLDGGAHSTEFWVSDGTTRGTRMIRVIQPRRGDVGIELGSLAGIDGGVLFIASDRDHGLEPWVSDGTRAGSRILLDIFPGRNGSIGSESSNAPVLEAGDRTYLVADDGVHGPRLWTTDGTTEGTRWLTDLLTDQGDPFSVTGWEHDGAALLLMVHRSDAPPTSDDAWVDRASLWRSDGTLEGTSLLRELGSVPRDEPCDYEARAVVEPTTQFLYFSAPEGEAGCRLWRTDGTTTGTLTLGEGRPSELPVFSDGQAYFITRTDDGDGEPTSVLWRTDGTRAGTEPVSRAGPTAVLAAQDGLYFVAGDGGDGERWCPWSTCYLWVLPTGRDGPSRPASASPPLEPGTSTSTPSVARELAAAFPREVGGMPVSVLERQGPSWLATYDPGDPDDAAAIAAIRGFVRSLGRGIDELSVASALVPVKGRPAAVTAVRVEGAERGALVDAIIPFLFADTVTPARNRKTIAGKHVIGVTDAAIPGSYPRYILPAGETVWLVEADERYLDEIFGALP